ncbi:LysR substrate-binding domain-containing protein [Radicibacter daui]|uniref:LysR substrate-binding domain-containing protein n=1 Tax=Radicibacter daui TaxID=3064829 RepID=UPI0040469623
MPNMLSETSGLMAFARTVEAGSFTAAARVLRTTPSAISKSVARLEKKLGARLFLRSTRALTLTQEGQVFFERIAPLLRDLDSSDEAIGSRSTLSGRLRISMPGEFAPLLLPRLFENFAAAHPLLTLEVGLTDRFVDLVREDYDVVLRIGNAAGGDYMVRTLAKLPMVVVASPTFVELHGQPRRTADLAGVPFARYVTNGVPAPVRLADATTFVPSGRVDCDSGAALIEAAKTGIGAAYLLRCLVDEDLKNGALVDLAPEIALPELPFNALHAFGHTVPMRVRLFCDFMADEAKTLGVR